MLAGDRSAEPQGEREQLFRHARGARDRIRIVPREQIGRVEVAVAGMPPRAGGEAQPCADGERLLDAFREVVERDGDVLARFAAALCVHPQGDAVPPPPQSGNLLRTLRRVHAMRFDLLELVTKDGRATKLVHLRSPRDIARWLGGVTRTPAGVPD